MRDAWDQDGEVVRDAVEIVGVRTIPRGIGAPGALAAVLC